MTFSKTYSVHPLLFPVRFLACIIPRLIDCDIARTDSSWCCNPWVNCSLSLVETLLEWCKLTLSLGNNCEGFWKIVPVLDPLLWPLPTFFINWGSCTSTRRSSRLRVPFSLIKFTLSLGKPGRVRSLEVNDSMFGPLTRKLLPSQIILGTPLAWFKLMLSLTNPCMVIFSMVFKSSCESFKPVRSDPDSSRSSKGSKSSIVPNWLLEIRSSPPTLLLLPERIAPFPKYLPLPVLPLLVMGPGGCPPYPELPLLDKRIPSARPPDPALPLRGTRPRSKPDGMVGFSNLVKLNPGKVLTPGLVPWFMDSVKMPAMLPPTCETKLKVMELETESLALPRRLRGQEIIVPTLSAWKMTLGCSLRLEVGKSSSRLLSLGRDFIMMKNLLLADCETYLFRRFGWRRTEKNWRLEDNRENKSSLISKIHTK